MLMSHSKYGKDAEGPASQDAVEYMSANAVPKLVFTGRRLVRRTPAPEILVGDPALARATIGVAPGELTYRSAVMTFATADIDATAFNAGDPTARGAVDLAFGLWSEIAFAGIPPRFRPPVFATTHTHLGRLEVNLLVPRWVSRSDGHLRSFNIDPPGPASRTAWDAFEDLLNLRFGWADPRDPARRRLVQIPDWRLKQRATAERAGEPWLPDMREKLAAELRDDVALGELHDRAGVLTRVQTFCHTEGLVIHGLGPDFITIGAVDARPSDRLRLTGLIFSEDFTGASSSAPEVAAARATEIAGAPRRLDMAWQRRAAFNASRYGLDAWPVATFCADDWATRPLAQPPRWIPPHRPPALLLEARNALPPTFDFDANGTPTPAPSSDPRRELGGAISRAGSQNSVAGSRGSGPGPGDPQLDQYARALAGPAGPGRILAALTARFQALLPKVSARLTLLRVARAIPENFLALPHLVRTLETLNARLARKPNHDTPAHDPVRQTRNDAGEFDRSDLAASSAAGSTRGAGDFDHGPARRDHGSIWKNRGVSADHSGGPGSHRGPGGERRIHGKGLAEDGPTAAAAGPEHRSRCAEHADVNRLAGRVAPRGSRAEFLKNLRQFCDRAAPGNRFSIRLLRTNDKNPLPRMGKDPEAQTTDIYFPASSGIQYFVSGPSVAMAALAEKLWPNSDHTVETVSPDDFDPTV